MKFSSILGLRKRAGINLGRKKSSLAIEELKQIKISMAALFPDGALVPAVAVNGIDPGSPRGCAARQIGLR